MNNTEVYEKNHLQLFPVNGHTKIQQSPSENVTYLEALWPLQCQPRCLQVHLLEQKSYTGISQIWQGPKQSEGC